ncbi:hypothetical protein ACFY1P_09250 [Streptomyces sp. NPDC001407]|uniref:hypothetical protein n=1 Tax=Streptomyces sp. NPDC001407 TaxID=3364573 RepID=UPI00369985DA
MTITLLRLSLTSTRGTFHHGATALNGIPLTVCGLVSPDLRILTERRGHAVCQECDRAHEVLTASRCEPERRFVEGADPRAAGHFQLPNLLRAYCGKTLGAPAMAGAKSCRPCVSLLDRIENFQRHTGYQYPHVSAIARAVSSQDGPFSLKTETPDDLGLLF